MPRRRTGNTVFDETLNRLIPLYEDGHRLVVSFSAGKDSGVCLEMCILAARMTNRLPVDVIMRDEEIMFPGTFEYAERIAERPEVNFHWIYACQPIINVFNRENPYWWVFDPLLDPDDWVRQPPSYAYQIPEKNIDSMTIPSRFPPAEGKNLYAVIGLRTSESRSRLMGLFSSKSHITKPNQHGVANVRPIYDWGDGDIWKAIRDNHWDYNEAYDVMARLGVKRSDLRIAPPTMNQAGAKWMALAERAWPRWFDKMCQRIPGTRAVAKYGQRAVMPVRKLTETWEQCYQRVCIDEAPQWIKERALEVKRTRISIHSHHSTTPLPEIADCPNCKGSCRSWKRMTISMYNGDPFSVKFDDLPYVEPEVFREGAGKWNGTPSF